MNLSLRPQDMASEALQSVSNDNSLEDSWVGLCSEKYEYAECFQVILWGMCIYLLCQNLFWGWEWEAEMNAKEIDNSACFNVK